MGAPSSANTKPSNYPARTSRTARIPLPRAGMAFDDPEIAMRIDAEGPVDVMTLMADLGGLIPLEYLRGSIAQRRALLAGLLDARATVDGTAGSSSPRPPPHDGGCRGSRHRTRLQLQTLRHRLVPRRRRRRCVHVAPPGDPPQELRRRAGIRRWSRSVRYRASRCSASRSTTTPPCTSPARPWSPPNSTLAMDFLRSASIGHHLTAAMFSLEMSKIEIVMRLLSAEAKIKLADMRSGFDERRRLEPPGRRMGEISKPPVHRRLTQPDDDGDPSQGPPPQTASRPETRCRGLRAADDLGQESRIPPAEVSEFSRSLKLLAKGTRGPRRRHLPAQPWPRTTHRQTPPGL